MTETTTTVVVANNDSTPPAVSIVSPLNGANVSGVVPIDTAPTDDLGVQKVQFWVDSTYLSFDASSPYSKSWNSVSVANGSHTIRVRAVDWAGNVSSDVTITVTVSN
jgi:hypothetical protein